MAVLAFIGGTCFWIEYRHLDGEEDHLNELPEGQLYTTKDVEEDAGTVQPVPVEIKEKN